MVIICIWSIFYPLYYIFLQVLFGVYWIFSIFMDSCQIYYSFSSILYKGNVVIIIFSDKHSTFFYIFIFLWFSAYLAKGQVSFCHCLSFVVNKKKNHILIYSCWTAQPNRTKLVTNGPWKFILYKWSWLIMGRDKLGPKKGDILLFFLSS